MLHSGNENPGLSMPFTYNDLDLKKIKIKKEVVSKKKKKSEKIARQQGTLHVVIIYEYEIRQNGTDSLAGSVVIGQGEMVSN